MDYSQFINDLFWVCVFLLEWGAFKLGTTYEALNIYLFVVLHPIVTLVLFVLWRRAAKRARLMHIQQSSNLEDRR
jgi:hypothetical protein